MKEKSFFNLFLYIVWIVWFILPIILASIAVILSFFMIIFPFAADSGDVLSFYLMIGSFIFFFFIVLIKFVFFLFQIIFNRNSKPKYELIISIFQLILSIPLYSLLFSIREDFIIMYDIINVFYISPFIIEIIILVVIGRDYFTSLYKISKKTSIMNIIIPGLGTLIAGGPKYTAIGYIQLILFVILLPFGLNNLLSIGAWIWGIMSMIKILSAK